MLYRAKPFGVDLSQFDGHQSHNPRELPQEKGDQKEDNPDEPEMNKELTEAENIKITEFWVQILKIKCQAKYPGREISIPQFSGLIYKAEDEDKPDWDAADATSMVCASCYEGNDLRLGCRFFKCPQSHAFYCDQCWADNQEGGTQSCPICGVDGGASIIKSPDYWMPKRYPELEATKTLHQVIALYYQLRSDKQPLPALYNFSKGQKASIKPNARHMYYRKYSSKRGFGKRSKEDDEKDRVANSILEGKSMEIVEHENKGMVKLRCGKYLYEFDQTDLLAEGNGNMSRLQIPQVLAELEKIQIPREFLM